MKTQTLFDISADLLELEYILTALDGELPEGEDGAALEAWFSTVHENRNQKLDNYAALIRQLEARSEIRKAEAARLTKLSKADENAAERLKERLRQFFVVQKIEDSISTDRFTFKLKKPGKAPVELTHKGEKLAVELPEGFRRTKFEADKTAIGEVLRSDDEERKELRKTLAEFATLGTPKASLLIR